jgi:octaprenyl-diphosphate synthase
MTVRTKKISLKMIRKPVEQELKLFGKVFREEMRSQVPLVDMIARYIIRQKGKRIRPLLVLLSAKVCGRINDSTYRAATLIELLHTATLVHDDVVDDADTRRNIPSINAVWKNKVAVLMGDYLLSRGLLISLKYDDFTFLKSTSSAVKRMSEGELLQIQKSRLLDLDEETYIKIIGDKTASLFSACAEIGAASSTGNISKLNHLRMYGEYLGIAFQIRDDLLDYLGRKRILGKATGRDLKEKKLTLPLIYTLRKSSRKEASLAIKYIRKSATRSEIRWILDYVKSYGGIDYTVRKAESYAELARNQLEPLHDSDSKSALLRLVDFVMSRES